MLRILTVDGNFIVGLYPANDRYLESQAKDCRRTGVICRTNRGLGDTRRERAGRGARRAIESKF